MPHEKLIGAPLMHDVINPDGSYTQNMNEFVSRCQSSVEVKFLQVWFESNDDKIQYLLTFNDPVQFVFDIGGFVSSFVPFEVA